MGGRLALLIALCLPLQADGDSLVEDHLRALSKANESEFGAVLERTFQVFDQRSRAHDYERALALAEGMRLEVGLRGSTYLRTHIWASSTLGLTQTRAGLHADAEATVSSEIALVQAELEALTRRLATEEMTPEDREATASWRAALRRDLVGLRDRRALARLGSGWIAGARADLGASLAGGSRDAALVLGRLALREGDLAGARRLFGSLLAEGEGEAWARRGWGISMLP